MNILKYASAFAMLICVGTSIHAAEKSNDFFTKTPAAVHAFLNKSKPLSEKELHHLVENNSILGHTCHTHSVYELFFEQDGVLIFRKSRDDKQVYIGKWWIKGNHIYSQWKSYPKKTSVNELTYHHLMGTVYVPYNINEACGPAKTFGLPFIVLKGDAFNLHEKRLGEVRRAYT